MSEIERIILPETGFVRLSQIVGYTRDKVFTPGVYPVSATAWWDGVRTGKYPKPVRLGERSVAWRAEDIRKLIDQISANEAEPTTGKKLTAKRQAGKAGSAKKEGRGGSHER
jgi:prophage regulatory protein